MSTNASVITVGQNVSGSVVAFQGTTPWVVNQGNSSIITVSQGSIAAVIIGGSILTTATPNQSVSGTVGASIIGAVPVQFANQSVIAYIQNSIATVIVGGSILTSSTPNQSVSGTVGASIIGLTPVNVTNTVTVVSSLAGGIFPVSGSVSAVVTNFPTTQNVSGSVVATQGTTPWQVVSSLAGGIFPISGSVAAVVTNTNLNVSGSVVAFQGAGWSGSVAAVIIGGSIATATTNSSVFLLNSPNTIGSVIAYQGVPSWNVGGSVVAFQGGTNITSLVSTIPSSVQVGASIFGQLPAGTAMLGSITAYQGAIPWTVNSVYGNISGSVVAFQGTTNWTVVSSLAGGIFPVSGSVAATIVGTPNVNTAGSVVSFQGGAWTHSVVGTVTALQSAGSVMAVSGVSVSISSVSQVGTWSTSVMTNVITSIATAGQVMGSVATLQGTMPWTTNFQNSSILSVPVGSVITVPTGSVIVMQQAPSIVGTYSVGGTYAAGNKAIATLGVRNDTLASIAATDAVYTLNTIGPAGELITANAPFTKWVSGTASMLGGVPLTCSVTVVAAQGASIFTYITGVQIANLSASSVLVSFGGATSSYIGYTIAPPGGGSNIYFANGLKTSANAAFSASVSGTASIFVSAQGFISKT